MKEDRTVVALSRAPEERFPGLVAMFSLAPNPAMLTRLPLQNVYCRTVESIFKVKIIKCKEDYHCTIG